MFCEGLFEKNWALIYICNTFVIGFGFLPESRRFCVFGLKKDLDGDGDNGDQRFKS